MSARLVGVSRMSLTIMVELGEFGNLVLVVRLLSELPDIPSQVSSWAPFSHPAIGVYLHKVDAESHCPLLHGLVDRQSALEVHGTGGSSKK